MVGGLQGQRINELWLFRSKQQSDKTVALHNIFYLFDDYYKLSVLNMDIYHCSARY